MDTWNKIQNDKFTIDSMGVSDSSNMEVKYIFLSQLRVTFSDFYTVYSK